MTPLLFQPKTMAGRAHARSSTTDVSPMTMEEFLVLIPGMPSPETASIFRKYRDDLEPKLAMLTPMLLKKGAKFRGAGFRVPDRFIQAEVVPVAPAPPPTVSREELLRVVRELYRELLTQRFASPGGPGTT